MVTINVGVMKEKGVIKRETLPLKVPSTASAEDIRLVAVKKHTLFNSRFIHSQSEYILAFKDGSEVKHIPGVGPEEPFTLRRYKEESGFGYARITLYLLPEGDIFEDLRRYVEEEDDLLCDGASKDSSDDEDFIKPALKPSLYPAPLKRQSFSSGRGKSTAAAPSTSSAGDDCFLVNCPTCWGTFPISAIGEHTDRCAQSVEELPDPHPVNSSCSRSTDIVSLFSFCALSCCARERNAERPNLQSCSKRTARGNKGLTVRRNHLWSDFSRARSDYYSPKNTIQNYF
ncbi:unnamed protein product [Porites lobata]|uniref:Uncharacterized protein n=1 Tax=Porites lobata TaxID=104759 RepID=A0ABN8NNN9_9CNID|nr:unnamed protein product [Porites lobata]